MVPLADARSIIIMETLQSSLPGMNARMPTSAALADLAHQQPAQSLHHQNREATISSSLLLLYATDSLEKGQRVRKKDGNFLQTESTGLGRDRERVAQPARSPSCQPPTTSLGLSEDGRGL